MIEGAPCWRVFPWDPEAEAGAPFSASFIPAQGAGRFDLEGVPVCYLAETAEHAVAERLLRFRGRMLEDVDLLLAGRRLALVGVAVEARLAAGVIDCCDPAALVAQTLRPDLLASSRLDRTQPIAAQLHRAGHAGLRWWSSVSGDWHTVVLFMDRLRSDDLHWQAPEPLTLEHPALEAACAALHMRRWRRPRPGRPPGRRRPPRAT